MLNLALRPNLHTALVDITGHFGNRGHYRHPLGRTIIVKFTGLSYFQFQYFFAAC